MSEYLETVEQKLSDQLTAIVERFECETGMSVSEARLVREPGVSIFLTMTRVARFDVTVYVPSERKEKRTA